MPSDRDFRLEAQDGKPWRLASKSDLATLFGVSATTIDRWVQRGCPVIRRGSKAREAQFSPRDVIRWRDQRARHQTAQRRSDQVVNIARERALKTRAERRLAEIELAALSRRMVAIEDVVERVDRDYSNVRSRILLMGRKLAPSVARLSDAKACQAAIDREAREALTELSSGEGIAREAAAVAVAADSMDADAGDDPPDDAA